MSIETAPSTTATFTCPPWCTWHRHSEHTATRLADVVHIETGHGMATAGYSGGHFELLADLTCLCDDEGRPTAPFIHLQFVGRQEAELKTTAAVDAVIGDLEAMLGELRRWRDQVGLEAAVPHSGPGVLHP